MNEWLYKELFEFQNDLKNKQKNPAVGKTNQTIDVIKALSTFFIHPFI